MPAVWRSPSCPAAWIHKKCSSMPAALPMVGRNTALPPAAAPHRPAPCAASGRRPPLQCPRATRCAQCRLPFGSWPPRRPRRQRRPPPLLPAAGPAASQRRPAAAPRGRHRWQAPPPPPGRAAAWSVRASRARQPRLPPRAAAAAAAAPALGRRPPAGCRCWSTAAPAAPACTSAAAGGGGWPHEGAALAACMCSSMNSCCLLIVAARSQPTCPRPIAHLHKLHEEVAAVADDLSRRLLLALGILWRGGHHLHNAGAARQASSAVSGGTTCGGAQCAERHALAAAPYAVMSQAPGCRCPHQQRMGRSLQLGDAVLARAAVPPPPAAVSGSQCGWAGGRAAPPAAACPPGRRAATPPWPARPAGRDHQRKEERSMLARTLFFSPAPAPLAKPANGLTPAPGRRLSGRSETSASSPIAACLCCSPSGLNDVCNAHGAVPMRPCLPHEHTRLSKLPMRAPGALPRLASSVTDQCSIDGCHLQRARTPRGPMAAGPAPPHGTAQAVVLRPPRAALAVFSFLCCHSQHLLPPPAHATLNQVTLCIQSTSRDAPCPWWSAGCKSIAPALLLLMHQASLLGAKQGLEELLQRGREAFVSDLECVAGCAPVAVQQ